MFQPTILQATRYGRFSVKLGVALLLIFFLLHPAIHSQELQALEVGKPIERELAGGQAHSYQLSLAAGQFLDAVVEQKGIDVEVTLFGPDGKTLIKVDSPNGTQGPEPMQWVVTEAGAYRLEVRSPEKAAGVGRYEVKIVELRAATETDRALMEALGLYNEAENLLRRGKYDEAIPLAERAFALREKALGPNHPDIANSLYNLALLYYAKGNYAKAETFHLRALGIREKALSPSHTDIANSLNNLAGLYYTKGDYAKAESLYQRALETLEKAFGPNRPEVATSLNNLAWLYYSKGDYAKAEMFHLRALEIRGKALGPNHPHVAISLNNLAELYHAKGDYAKAETFHLRALEIREKVFGPNHPDVANSLNNLASLYLSKGDYAKAEPRYQRALEIQEKALGSHHPSVAISLNNLAELYHQKGDYVKAEPLFQLVLETQEKAFGPNHPYVAIPLHNLAGLYSRKGDYPKAEASYQRAQEILKKAFGPNHPQVAISLNSLAELYRTKGDYAKAEPLFQRAVEIQEKALGPNHPQIAVTLNNLAVLYWNKGDYVKAEPLHQRALEIKEHTRGPNHPDVAISLNNLAMLYRDKGDVQQAIAFASRATEVSEYNLGHILITGSERQKLLFLALRSGETNSALSLHAQFAPHDPRALKLACTTLLRRKGRGLEAATDVIVSLRRRAQIEDQTLLDKFSDLRSQLATLTLRGPGRLTPDQYRSRLQQLEGEADKLEAELSLRSAEFRVQVQPATIEAIQAAIPMGAALVEFAIYQPYDAKTRKFGPARYAAYVLAREGEPSWVELGEAATVDRNVTALRQTLRDPQRSDVRRLARTLDAQVMRPVRALLGPTRRVLISPDGALNLIPFAALVDERNQYLVERYSIGYLTSGRDLLRLQVPRQSKSEPLIVADPAFGAMAGAEIQLAANVRRSFTRHQTRGPLKNFSEAYFEPLPETGREARDIKKLLPQATVLTKDQANETALKKLSAPRILHIATHGFFLQDEEASVEKTRSLSLFGGVSDLRGSDWAAKIENPLLRSGLALAGFNQHKGGDDDGALTALEAAGLDLWGTKLVVLSACDTGVGEVKNGEGVYGLRRALVLAGSESQVMSLWKVSDYVTRLWMTDYYKGLKQGQGRGEALRQVQLKMLKGREFRHPFYWASFIQSGEWANLDGQR